MSIVYHESSKIFHLYNQTISYIMMVLPNGHMGQLYYGKKIRDKEDFSYLLELAPRDMASYLYENDRTFSLGHIKLEYGTYGSGDYRYPAVEILQNDGSTYQIFNLLDIRLHPESQNCQDFLLLILNRTGKLKLLLLR